LVPKPELGNQVDITFLRVNSPGDHAGKLRRVAGG